MRIVGREQDLLRRHLAHQIEKIDDAPERGIEEDSRNVAEVPSEPAQIGDARVGDDQANVGVAVDECGEMVADRRQAAAAVDQDRDVALDREGEDRVEALVTDRELLRARMQLDPAGAEVETADCLLDRALVEVEPHEREDSVRVVGRVGERAVVRCAERRHAVGLVEATRRLTYWGAPDLEGYVSYGASPRGSIFDLPDIPPSTHDALRGIRARAQELGWDVATVSANEDKLKQINGVQDLVARGVKGILISPIDAVGVNGAYDAANIVAPVGSDFYHQARPTIGAT